MLGYINIVQRFIKETGKEERTDIKGYTLHYKNEAKAFYSFISPQMSVYGSLDVQEEFIKRMIASFDSFFAENSNP